MTNPLIQIDSFNVLPLSFMLVIAVINVWMAVRGRFTPWQLLMRGLGSSVYIFGYGLCFSQGMKIDGTAAAIMMWGIAISATPRFASHMEKIGSLRGGDD